MNNSINRRTFLKQSTAIGAGLVTGRVFAAGNSPNEKLLVAVMGCHGRGMAHIQALLAMPNVGIAYICDVDSRAVAKGIKAVATKTGKEPKGEKDIRRVLDDKSVDAITIAAPNHWHAIATILACKAGKHVFVEKPGSHNPYEAEMMVAAARKYNRVVQLGNQRRSMPGIIEAIKKVHNGEIGKVLVARSWYTRLRPSIGIGKLAPVPEWLDYQLWQGPAPERPYKDNVVHYNWHFFWHWGNGELGNNAIHYLDVCRWGLKVDIPRRVTWGGGRYLFKDDQETPDTGVATFDFGDKFISWEQSCSHDRKADTLASITFYGDNGTIAIMGTGYKHYDKKGKEVGGWKTSGEGDTVRGPGGEHEHFANWLDAIRKGTPLNSEIGECQKSTMLCHYANMSVRTGRTINVDPQTGKVIGDPEAMALWKREYRPGWEPTL
ncbi:MAG: Gfo/Idh/MocA family oxidoreductase [Verrucomicrobiae bacterium]|nr:Gfo/Idh/MocA family oxidoreductase [Verrucomicrobiae bacterium]